MKQPPAVTAEEIDALVRRLHEEAESSGYHLNPDPDFTRELVRGLLINERRYGYWGCPCRLCSGNRSEDLDIICPCDYRDPDLQDFDMCYCALYVSRKVLDGKKKPAPIPERRPVHRPTAAVPAGAPGTVPSGLPMTVWRCRVCGYLCARQAPPLTCPICKADKDRFEPFLT